MAKRSEVLNKIDNILLESCQPCKRYRQTIKDNRGISPGRAIASKYCMESCSKGIELQRLGQQLGRTLRKNR